MVLTCTQVIQKRVMNRHVMATLSPVGLYATMLPSLEGDAGHAHKVS